MSITRSALHTSATGVLWFAGAAVLLAASIGAIAEVMVFRLSSLEEYVGLIPAVAIVPWFFAGSLFPISVLPKALEGVAKVLPSTHALALMRYGLVDGSPSGLQTIWGQPRQRAACSGKPHRPSRLNRPAAYRRDACVPPLGSSVAKPRRRATRSSSPAGL